MAFLAAIPAWVGIATSAAGAAVAAGSTYMQAKAQSNAHKANADIKRLASIEAGKEGAAKEQLSREKSTRLMSHIRALYGASGAEMTGSPLDVMADQAYQSEMDALTIRHQASLEQWKDLTDAGQYGWMAKTTKTAGMISAGSSILTSAGSMMGSGKYFGGAGRKKMLSLEDERDDYFTRNRY